MRGRWVPFVARRLATLLASLAVLVTATFLITHLVPGDPARAGLGPTAPLSQIKARRVQLHLNESLPAQFGDYVRGIVHGDLGRSFTSGQPVGQIIHARFPATLRLGLLSFALSVLLGLPLGMLMAVLTRGRRHPVAEGTFSVLTGLMISVPDYLIATALVALFGVTLTWLPIAGDATWQAYVLPVVSYSAVSIGLLARVARVETLAVLDQEYMRMARSKRLPAARLYLRHVLPNTLTATLTISGLVLGATVAGTVVIENVFAWPGLGSAIVQAIEQKDYPLVQGIVLLLGSIVLVVNLIVDLLLAALDPRSLIRES